MKRSWNKFLDYVIEIVCLTFPNYRLRFICTVVKKKREAESSAGSGKGTIFASVAFFSVNRLLLSNNKFTTLMLKVGTLMFFKRNVLHSFLLLKLTQLLI